MYLGISAFFHDASAAIVDKDGRVIAAVQEERFTHRKREARFPIASIRYCLEEAGIGIHQLDGIGFAWNPYLLILQRILWSNVFRVPASFAAIKDNLQRVGEILRVPQQLQKAFGSSVRKVPFRYFRHHACHAASAYYASPFERAAFLTVDGQGELECITWGKGEKGTLDTFGQTFFPHSIGKVYSATCRFLGFSGAEKDGTVMALAAFGTPRYLETYRRIIRPTDNHHQLHLNVDKRFFNFHTYANTVQPSHQFQETFGIPPRQYDEPITQVHKDIAASLQKRTEEVIIELLNRLHALTGEDRLVLAGGVALNSVLNGKLEDVTPFKQVFIQPAANDAGLALGAAYLLRQKEHSEKPLQGLTSAALGPSFDEKTCKEALEKAGLDYERPDSLAQTIVAEIADGKIAAWFQGRMEFGPRALGRRSLLGDARSPKMVERLNMVKKREAFRPFAISILQEEAANVLEHVNDSPFMLKADRVRPEWQKRIPGAQHIDGSVRIQTVREKENGLYYDLIQAFHELTGVPLILNTSLNIKGQPIVCTPQEAIETFVNTPIDLLVLGPFLVRKSDIPM